MTTMSVVGECFFWYRLTRVVPDRFHRAVKWLCVCVCPAYVIHQRTMLYTWLVMCIAHRWTTHMAGLPCNPSAVAGSPAYGVCHLGGRHRTGNSAGGQWQNCTTCRQWEGRWEIRNTYGSSVTRTMRGWLNNNGETLGQNRGGVGHFLID